MTVLDLGQTQYSDDQSLVFSDVIFFGSHVLIGYFIDKVLFIFYELIENVKNDIQKLIGYMRTR